MKTLCKDLQDRCVEAKIDGKNFILIGKKESINKAKSFVNEVLEKVVIQNEIIEHRINLDSFGFYVKEKNTTFAVLLRKKHPGVIVDIENQKNESYHLSNKPLV